MSRLQRFGVVASLLALPLVGCGSDGDEDEPSEIPNPASEFCVEQGGTLEIETDDDGNQTGICVLPSGERVDEWEYFREHGDD